jgi:hypothetical protein
MNDGILPRFLWFKRYSCIFAALQLPANDQLRAPGTSSSSRLVIGFASLIAHFLMLQHLLLV